MQNKPRIFAVSHHSPLDIVSLFPDNVVVTYDPTAEADVLICSRLPENDAKVGTIFVFSQNPPEDITVLDETKPGEIRSITMKVIDQVFSSTVVIKGRIVRPKPTKPKMKKKTKKPVKKNIQVKTKKPKPKPKAKPKPKPKSKPGKKKGKK